MDQDQGPLVRVVGLHQIELRHARRLGLGETAQPGGAQRAGALEESGPRDGEVGGERALARRVAQRLVRERGEELHADRGHPRDFARGARHGGDSARDRLGRIVTLDRLLLPILTQRDQRDADARARLSREVRHREVGCRRPAVEVAGLERARHGGVEDDLAAAELNARRIAGVQPMSEQLGERPRRLGRVGIARDLPAERGGRVAGLGFGWSRQREPRGRRARERERDEAEASAAGAERAHTPG